MDGAIQSAVPAAKVVRAGLDAMAALVGEVAGAQEAQAISDKLIQRGLSIRVEKQVAVSE